MDDVENEEGPEALDEESQGEEDVGAEEGAREPWLLPVPGGEFSSEGAGDDAQEGADPHHYPDLAYGPSLDLNEPDA